MLPQTAAVLSHRRKSWEEICFNPAKVREDTWAVAWGSIPRDKLYMVRVVSNANPLLCQQNDGDPHEFKADSGFWWGELVVFAVRVFITAAKLWLS